MLIAFAAKGGSTAADGDSKNSPFSTALASHLTTPGLDIRKALGLVRDDVLKATGEKQEPFVYGSLGGEDLALAPATAVAAMAVLENTTSISGKKVLVVGRGRTVGRPAAAMLVNRDATVTVCHSKSKDMQGLIAGSDIILTATGQPKILDHRWFRKDQIVIDCGISFIDNKTVGDVDSSELLKIGVAVTPVPGGIGAITNSVIYSNLMKAIPPKYRTGQTLALYIFNGPNVQDEPRPLGAVGSGGWFGFLSIYRNQVY